MVKVGADGLRQSKGVSTLKKYFSRSINVWYVIQFWRRNLRFCICNEFPVMLTQTLSSKAFKVRKSSSEFKNENGREKRDHKKKAEAIRKR